MPNKIEKEKLSHIENIDKSMEWLKENGLWKDFREIVMEGVMELANNIKKERVANFDFTKFEDMKNKSDRDNPYDKNQGD